jgi:hypothetical protein
MAEDSETKFTTTNHPTAGRPTTPKDEFFVVVGAAGVDTNTWTLRPDAAPRCPTGTVLEVKANTYSTTIGLIISGLIKLGRIATAPRDAEGTAAAFRGIAGLELLPAFFTPDEQGFCGVVRVSCPCPTTRPWRQSTAGRRTAKWPSFSSSSWAKPRSAPRSRGCRSFLAIANGSCRRGPTFRFSGARRAGPME